MDVTDIAELRLAIIDVLCNHNLAASRTLLEEELRSRGLDAYPQRVNYHLNALVEKGFIQRKRKGLYLFVGDYTYCLPFLDMPRFGLVSGLGERQSRMITVVEVAVEALRAQNIFVDSVRVLLTGRSRRSWGTKLDELKDNLGVEVNFVGVGDDAISDLDSMGRILREVVSPMLKITVPIVDCTSLTKIYTISAYSIALELSLPLIYIYEKTRRLIWIRDIKTVKEEILDRLRREVVAKK